MFAGARLALFGHSGVGKSTSAGLLTELCEQKGLRVERLKLAEPLYALQQAVYERAGKTIAFYDQDQPLLETLAAHLRRISATALVGDFERRLGASQADVVINDDVRDRHVDGPRLRQLGFRFVRIECDAERRHRRLQQRGDTSTVHDSATTRDIELIPADAVVDNATDEIEDLRTRLADIVGSFL